jgi:hypothetical protein
MTDAVPLTPGDPPEFDKPPAYRSYLLRFWEERSSQPALTVWRFSLEDPHTTHRQSFADLNTLVAWLAAETGSPLPGSVSPTPQPLGGAPS